MRGFSPVKLFTLFTFAFETADFMRAYRPCNFIAQYSLPLKNKRYANVSCPAFDGMPYTSHESVLRGIELFESLENELYPAQIFLFDSVVLKG